MHPLPLVVFLTLAAGPDHTIPVGCREDFEICREDCTIGYGGGTTKYRQLRQCLQGCENDQAECTTRHYSLRDTGYDAPREAPPASRPETPRDGVRRGVYRATESEPAPEVEPAVMKEPEPAPEAEPEARPEPKPKNEVKRASGKSGDMRIFGEDEPEPEAEPEPAPRRAPKREEPPRPVVPAEPKKKDISDWEPNER